MRIATWNINSVRARTERAVGVLGRWNLDVLLLQETKCRPEQFPVESFRDAGYEVAAHGLDQWNGVAIVSRVGIEDLAVRALLEVGAKEATILRDGAEVAIPAGELSLNDLIVVRPGEKVAADGVVVET